MNQLDQMAFEASAAMELLAQQVQNICEGNPNWITHNEAADMLGVTRARISMLCKRGMLRGTIGHNTTYVYKPDVLARLEYISKYGKPRRGPAKDK